MMQKESMFVNEGDSMHQDHHNSDLNCGFFNPNWENSVSIDQNDPFESAFSSMVSSPTASNNAGNGENIVLRELIGRLGSICNSGEISPQPYSTNTSCYTTPLNSPPKLNLSSMIGGGNPQIPAGNLNFPGLPNLVAPFSTDPGFAERAARFSCFANNSGQLEELVGPNSDSGKISRVSSNQILGLEKGESRENSSVSEQIPAAAAAAHSRKRKSSVPKGKGKETPPPPPKSDANVSASENGESNAKRSKSEDENGNEKDESKTERNEKKDSKTQLEPPKDYIHVRARRGQATDAHSLAERVRREKISERMKVLQDLVPGCNKVTGKAVMLDEIINYVQSLQRQVEFLSMKLSTVNPRMEFNTEALMSNDMFRSHGSFPHNVYSSEGYLMQSQPNLSVVPNGTEAPFLALPNQFNARNQTVPLPGVDSFSEATSQVLTSWEDDLHSVVQMGFGQNQTQNFHGILPSPQMKVEL